MDFLCFIEIFRDFPWNFTSCWAPTVAGFTVVAARSVSVCDVPVVFVAAVDSAVSDVLAAVDVPGISAVAPAVDTISAVADVPVIAVVSLLYILIYPAATIYLTGILFALPSKNRNLENRIGQLEKISFYRRSDKGLNLSDYLISDSRKCVGYPTLLNNRNHYSPYFDINN